MNDRVLLIQRNRAPSEGLWTLPGGRLEPGETLEQCAIREVRDYSDSAHVNATFDLGG